jgi:hypothetical protein
MFSYAYLKTVGILLATLLIAMLAGVPLRSLVMMLPARLTNVGGFALFLSVVLIWGVCLEQFADRFLFEKGDQAELQVVGGIRFGGAAQMATTGKGASWPFAKLSASPQALRLQTPFGNYAWDGADPHLKIRSTGRFFGEWEIGSDDAKPGDLAVFSAWPWERNATEAKLGELGYELRP